MTEKPILQNYVRVYITFSGEHNWIDLNDFFSSQNQRIWQINPFMHIILITWWIVVVFVGLVDLASWELDRFMKCCCCCFCWCFCQADRYVNWRRRGCCFEDKVTINLNGESRTLEKKSESAICNWPRSQKWFSWTEFCNPINREYI